MHFLFFTFLYFPNRDLNDYRKRCESAMYELHFKENQVRELQKGLESSKGCKYYFDDGINFFFNIFYELC